MTITGNNMLEGQFFRKAVLHLIKTGKHKTREGFCTAIGHNYQSFCSIMTGVRTLSDNKALQFAAALGTTPMELIDLGRDLTKQLAPPPEPETQTAPPLPDPAGSKLGYSETKLRNLFDQVLDQHAGTREELARCKTVLAMLPIAIMIIDRQMNVKYQNPASMGLSYSGVDKPCIEVCPAQCCDDCVGKKAFETGSPQHKCHEDKAIFISATPVLHAGEISEVIICICDHSPCGGGGR